MRRRKRPRDNEKGTFSAACHVRALRVLEAVEKIELVEIGKAVRAALCQPSAAKDPLVLGSRAVMPIDVIADHVVFGGERFDVRDATAQFANRAKPALDLCRVDVLEHVRADDEIALSERFDRAKCAE